MKKMIKYAIVSFLIFIAFIATSERFVYHLSTFEQTYGEITFEYLVSNSESTDNSIKKQVLNDLKERNFDVYKVDTKYVSDYYMVKTIYGTSNSLDYLRTLGIKPGLYTSLFIGDVEIKFASLNDIEDIHSSDIFRFIGTYEEAAAFKNISFSDISSLYQVVDINKTSGSEDGVYLTIFLIWGIVFAFILLLSLYNVILSRKETVVKLTLGISPWRTFIESSLIDIIVYIIIFFGISSLLNIFIFVKYKFNIICTLFILMLILNTIINSTINNISIKKDMSNNKKHNGALISTYIIKSISLILTIIVLSANSIIFTEAISYFSQKSFFENKENYNYYRFYYSLANSDRNNITEKQDFERIDLLWKDFEQKFGNDSICAFDMTETFEIQTILLNSNAARKLQYCKNSDLLNKISKTEENKIYIFFPENQKFAPNTFTAYIRSLFLRGRNDIEIIEDSYKGTSNLIAINKTTNAYRSTILKQPVIILDTVNTPYTERYLNPKYYGENILYKISPDCFKMFTEEHKIADEIVTVTNAKDLYFHNYNGFERNIKLISVVSLLICVLEIIMIIFLINLEYINHGIELAIKKTLGYSIVSRNFRAFIIPIILIPICTILSCITLYVSNLGSSIHAFLIGVLLLIFEIIFTLYRSIKIEYKNISTILKGEQS